MGIAASICLGQIVGSNHGISAELLMVAHGAAQRGANGGGRRDADVGIKQQWQT